ncbi:MAG: ABC transporter ATP-binding protein [Acetatifactor sp.]|nr:ABC transporter ATP-binding protein [Acetatifactor sp.]
MKDNFFGFDHLTIKYGRKTVVSNLSFAIREGKITTLIGKNGCGKSSLLRSVFGAVKPSGGVIYYQGRPIGCYGTREMARKIAYLPQVHDAPPDVTVKTLVSYGRYPYQKFGRGLTKADLEIINDTIQFTGLTSMEDCLLTELSGGERQRAWIAMTICQRPKILILDEPTTYLDVGHQIDVLELVRKMNRELGTTIVMVLHDVNLAVRYSDDLYAIRDGGICCEGNPEEMVTKDRLRKIFDVEAAIGRDKANDCPYFIPLRTIG